MKDYGKQDRELFLRPKSPSWCMRILYGAGLAAAAVLGANLANTLAQWLQ